MRLHNERVSHTEARIAGLALTIASGAATIALTIGWRERPPDSPARWGLTIFVAFVCLFGLVAGPTLFFTRQRALGPDLLYGASAIMAVVTISSVFLAVFGVAPLADTLSGVLLGSAGSVGAFRMARKRRRR